MTEKKRGTKKGAKFSSEHIQHMKEAQDIRRHRECTEKVKEYFINIQIKISITGE